MRTVPNALTMRKSPLAPLFQRGLSDTQFGVQPESRLVNRCAVSISVILFLGLLMIGSDEAAPAEFTFTVISYPDRPAKLPLWLAQDSGLFEKYGLKVDIRAAKSSDDLIEGLKRNEARIYAATANWIVSAIGDGKDLVFFANTGYSVLKLVARPEITRAQDLKGKRIGTGEPNSSQDRITRQALQRLGLDPAKIGRAHV